MKIFLLFFSLFSRLASQIKNFFYDWKLLKPQKAPLPVVSIGNIALGGTEKTPLVMEILSFLERSGEKPALITRGYKGRWEKKGGILSDGRTIFGTWQDSGDEPFMVAKNFPQAGVFVGGLRLQSCLKANELGFTIAVLDDGFQHRRLVRNVDIVLHDPEEKIALRESFSSLRRADLVLIKKGIEVARIKKIRKFLAEPEVLEYSVINKGFFRLDKKEMIPAGALQGKKILAFCGIARPQRFFSLLKEEDLEIVFSFNFPDHFSYPRSALDKIIKKYEELKPQAALTTEKDAVKIVENEKFLEFVPIYYPKIGLRLDEKFYERIKALLQKHSNL